MKIQLQRHRFWTRPPDRNKSVYCCRSFVSILATDFLLFGASYYLVAAADPNGFASTASRLPLWLDPILDDLLAVDNKVIPKKGDNDAETNAHHQVSKIFIVNPEISQENVVVTCNLYALVSSLLQQQRTDQESLLMDYRLFRKGRSALRDLVPESDNNHNIVEALRLLQCLRDPNIKVNEDSNHDDKNDVDLRSDLLSIKTVVTQSSRTVMGARSNAFVALLLLLFLRHYAGGSDIAHEVVLGVNLNNMEQAEYAARHRGQSGVVPWSHTHPLSDSDDAVHSILHRVCEGGHHGEGGHTDNAKYWAAGGPKRRYDPNLFDKNNHGKWPRQHPVRAALAQAALKHAPCAVAAGVVVNESDERTSCRRTHRIIQGGGENREVCVPNSWWDPFCFIDLIAQQHQQQQKQEELTKSNENTNLSEELDWLQQLEFALLLRYEALMQSDGPSSF